LLSAYEAMRTIGQLFAFSFMVFNLSLSLVPLASYSQEPVRSITLDQAVQIALEKASLVLKSENQNTLSGQELLQRYAQFLPNLNAAANYVYHTGTNLYTFTTVTLVDSNSQTSTYSLSSTLNIFNGFLDSSALRAALNRKSAAELSLSYARLVVQADITQSFLQVILDQRIILIAQQNLTASQARERLLKEQTQVGTTSMADYLRQQAQTSSDQLSLINAETRLKNDSVLLTRKLILDLNQTYRFSDAGIESISSPSIHLPDAQLIQTALANRPDFQSQEKLVSASESDIDVARSDYFPKLNFAVTFGGLGTFLTSQNVNGANLLPSSQRSIFTQLGDQTQWTFGFYLNWNLFDRLLTQTAVTRTELTRSNTEIDLRDKRLDIEAQVKQVKNDLNSAFQQLQTSKVALSAAQQSYATIQGRYRLGASSFIDLLAAQATLVHAQSALAQSEIAVKLQTRLLDLTIGNKPSLESYDGNL
jgi:outer membrane protein